MFMLRPKAFKSKKYSFICDFSSGQYLNAHNDRDIVPDISILFTANVCIIL